MQKRKSHQSLLLVGVLGVTPVVALVSGCNGGSNNGGVIPNPTSNPTPSPTTTATATPTGTRAPTPTPTPITPQTSNLTLGNGQRAVLTTTTRGTAISGTLRILAPVAPARSVTTRALTYLFRVGTYQITGTFTPPRGFSITGTDNGQRLFTMNGQLATATQTGSYTLTVNSQTETGIIPRIGQPFPTPTATPRPTTPPVGGITSNLTFTPSGGSNFVNAPLTTGTFTLVSSANIVGAALQSNVQAGRDGVFLAVTGIQATVGTTSNIDPTFGANGYIYNYTPSGLIRVFRPDSGSVTLVALSQNTATFRLNNVVYAANEGNIAIGKVTVNGTVTGPLRRL